MAAKRKIEIFSAGCGVCDDAVDMVNNIAHPADDEVSVLDINDPAVVGPAKMLGIRSVPAIVKDGKLADCCAGRGPEEAVLKQSGIGSPA